jgi:very-short-patch-repair endonuclease
MDEDEKPPAVVGRAGVNQKKKAMARQLRRKPTTSEAVVWEWLRDRKVLGLKFRRQQAIRGYIVDFYCPELGLAIELDGPIHGIQVDLDRLRQSRLEGAGIRCLRIPNREVSHHALVSRIESYIAETQKVQPSEGS